jgi:hypothetical protein
MRALIVYESMYGNTHVVADHIADGLRSYFETEVVPVQQATSERMHDVHLLVVGGPTHVHSVSSEKSRQAAVEAAHKPDADVELDPDAEGEGLREWFHHVAKVSNAGAAAFDTRIDAASWLTGRASKGIGRRLTSLGYDLVADPESFLVDKQNHLLPGEADRAVAWGATLASSLAVNP